MACYISGDDPVSVKHLSETEKDEVICSVRKCIGGLQGIINKGFNDDDAEFSFTDIAHLMGLDRKKPRLIAGKFPLPCTTPSVKTCEFVWKWEDLKKPLIKEVFRHAIMELADTL